MSVSNNLRKLSTKLFEDEQARNEFEQAVVGGNSERQGLIWLASRPQTNPFEVLAPASWQPEFVDAIADRAKPGAHPLHEGGSYYCLDLSSVFEAAVLCGIKTPVKRALDVCAAPGGKSVFTSRLLAPAELIANETIRKRGAALASNFKRCKISGQIICSDPKILAETYPQQFDLVIVDAPCSGQSLVARGEHAPSCFHFATVNLNSNRQKRIIANSAATVAPGGYLAYMTCTYAPQENEKVVEWLIDRFPEFSSVEAPRLNEHRSRLTENFCYRLFPQEGFGAGGFTALLRRDSADNG